MVSTPLPSFSVVWASYSGVKIPGLISLFAIVRLRDVIEAMSTETLYEGPAHEATFYVPSGGGIVRFRFSDLRASGYVRSRDGSLFRVQPGSRQFLPAGHHLLSLYDPQLVARVSITFEPL